MILTDDEREWAKRFDVICLPPMIPADQDGFDATEPIDDNFTAWVDYADPDPLDPIGQGPTARAAIDNLATLADIPAFQQS